MKAGSNFEEIDQIYSRAVLQRLNGSSHDFHLFTNIHRLLRNKRDAYTSIPSLAGYDVVAIVRDPVDRLVSTYKFFVFQEREVERMEPERLPVRGRPTLEQFVEHLEVYAELSPVLANHLRPQRDVYGPSLEHLSHVFTLEDIGSAYEHINSKSEIEVPFYNENKGRYVMKQKVSEFSVEKIREIYKEDFLLYESAK